MQKKNQNTHGKNSIHQIKTLYREFSFAQVYSLCKKTTGLAVDHRTQNKLNCPIFIDFISQKSIHLYID